MFSLAFALICVQYFVSWQSRCLSCKSNLFAPPAGEKWSSRRRTIKFVPTRIPSFHQRGLSRPPNVGQHLQPPPPALPASQGPIPDDTDRWDPNGTGQTQLPPDYTFISNVPPTGGAITGAFWTILGRDPQDSRDSWRHLVRAPGCRNQPAGATQS